MGRAAYCQNLEACYNPFVIEKLEGENASYRRLKPWVQLTRFLKGHPSSTPDVRTPDDLTLGADESVQSVMEFEGGEALHVRTMTGQLVLSIGKAEAMNLSVASLLEDLSVIFRKAVERVSLVHDGQTLESKGILHDVLEQDGDSELLVVIGQPACKPERYRSAIDEEIPEDLPGDWAATHMEDP